MLKETRDQKRERLRNYITNQVNPIVEKLIVDSLITTPDDFVKFAITWLNQKGNDLQQSQKKPISGEQNQLDLNSSLLDIVRTSHRTLHSPSNSEKQGAEQEQQFMDLAEQKRQISKAQNQGTRPSVSAEVFGEFNKKADYVPRMIPQTKETKKRIQDRLNQAFMFQALDEKDREIVINSMEEKLFEEGQAVIRQGDDGDVLYVVDDGLLDCFRRFQKDEEQKFLKNYKPGDSFGELSLLYNAPRAATIKAQQRSILFALDRACFNNIVKEAAYKRRQRFETVLLKVELLSTMDPYERIQLADGLKQAQYQQGQIVIQQGDAGDRFYMVEEGNLIATKVLNEGEAPTTVFSYQQGDYFGELALIRNIPRQANIIASSECKLVYLDNATFKRLLGPIEDILKRNEEQYKQYMTN